MLIALSWFSGKMGESIRELAVNSYEIVDFKSVDLQKNKELFISKINRKGQILWQYNYLNDKKYHRISF